MDFPSKVLYDSDHNVSTTCEHIKSLFNVCMGKLFPLMMVLYMIPQMNLENNTNVDLHCLYYQCYNLHVD